MKARTAILTGITCLLTNFVLADNPTDASLRPENSPTVTVQQNKNNDKQQKKVQDCVPGSAAKNTDKAKKQTPANSEAPVQNSESLSL